MPFVVNNRLCATCIFRSNTPISKERFDQLREERARDNAVQICHHSQDNVGCRGHYEAARRGEIPHPMPALLADTLGIQGSSIEDVMQICERLHLVEFVNVDDQG